MAAAAILDFCTNSNNSAADWRRWNFAAMCRAATGNGTWARIHKKDRTQKVTENALLTQTPFPSFHIDWILHVGSYPGYLSWFQVLLDGLKNVGAVGVVIGLLLWPVGVSKNTKKDRTQKVTENALLTHTPFSSSHTNHMQNFACGVVSRISFLVSSFIKIGLKCGSCGGRNFGLSIVDCLHVKWQATRNAQYSWPMADSRSGDVQKSWVVVMESQTGLENSYYDVDSCWWVVSIGGTRRKYVVSKSLRSRLRWPF